MPTDIDAGKLSDVIGKIYDSAVDPPLWPAALESACALIGGTLGYIVQFDTQRRSLDIPQRWGGDDDVIRKYQELVPHMPFWEVMTQYQIGEIAHTSDLLRRSGLSEEEMLNSTFFREWAQPYALRDVVAGIVVNAGERLGSINMHTPLTRDVVGPRDIAVMELLLPHARRAITIGNLLDMKSLANAAFEATLNTLNTAIVLVDANSRIQQVNLAAEKMLSAGGPIVSSRGELTTHQPDATAALRNAITRAASDESELGYGGIGVPIKGVRPDSAILPSIAHVLPLKSGKLRPGLSLGAVAAVFISPASEANTAPVEALAALYDLTPTEARVMIEIASGKNRVAASQALGIADSTVKTHLSRVFEKTRTSDQAELAKMIASLTPPALRRTS
jgi:DNA-binding CsgD family transcriptional regulator/PAS domain-containing protein